MMNRKLVRPNLQEVKERYTTRSDRGSRDTNQGDNGTVHPRRRAAPPDQTNAEAFYYLKQMNGKTPMTVVLDDGERLTGWIEWYDQNCVKVHREDGPNLLLYKRCIRYLYKAEDETA
ncbi:MAG: RNA chaperone Hfq [Acidobacteriota bacterium]|nr:RNA chaperone Hfq [Acidobacteriota bacterium]